MAALVCLHSLGVDCKMSNNASSSSSLSSSSLSCVSRQPADCVPATQSVLDSECRRHIVVTSSVSSSTNSSSSASVSCVNDRSTLVISSSSHSSHLVDSCTDCPSHKCIKLSSKVQWYGVWCDGASQTLHPLDADSDADFMCKIHRMRMCRIIKITSYYIQLTCLKLNS